MRKTEICTLDDKQTRPHMVCPGFQWKKRKVGKSNQIECSHCKFYIAPEKED